MKILIADSFDDSGVEALRSESFEITHRPGLTADDLPEAITEVDPDIVVVRSTKVSAKAIDCGLNLSLIIRAGAGYDTIDLDRASAKGVFVANCPGKNALAVAELTWGLILACDRRIPDQTADLRDGRWKKKEYGKSSGLAGRTLGVIGAGRIGRAVIARAHAFEMKVATWDRSITEQEAGELQVTHCESLVNLAKMSDVVSVHLPSVPETKHLINDKFIDSMRQGAILINTSRGALVDEKALRRGITEKGLRAGLDVYENEPSSGTSEFTNDLISQTGVYGTHHVGASTDQAQESVAMEVVRIILSYRNSGEVPNCVNRATAGRSAALLTVRHMNKPGVLARVFDILGQAALNVEEMENLIYEGGQSACARIQLGKTPSIGEVKAIEEEETVLGVSVASIENKD
jgi:D-3-phosphoglycerate dehydrogenase